MLNLIIKKTHYTITTKTMIIKKPSILFVHPDLRGGGAEKVLVNLLNSLDPDRYDIHLLTYFEEGVNRKDLRASIKQRYIFKKVFRGWSVLQKLFSPRKLYRLFINEKYDIIIAYLEGVPTRMVSGCPHKQTKLISWLHTDLNLAGIEKVYWSNKEMKACYARFDRVIAVSDQTLESCINQCNLDRAHGQIIHNVIDTDSIIKNAVQSLNGQGLKRDVINICSVGRLTKIKGYDRLIQSLSKIIEDFPKVHLYLLGIGEEKTALENLVSQLKMEDYVSFLGFQKNPHRFVSKCDLFVCSSYHEGYSTAVTEAVILGTPVLTTQCSGMNEILDNGEIGMIVENSNHGIYQGLYKLLSRPELLALYADKTRGKSNYYQQNNNATQVEELFDTLLN